MHTRVPRSPRRHHPAPSAPLCAAGLRREGRCTSRSSASTMADPQEPLANLTPMELRFRARSLYSRELARAVKLEVAAEARLRFARRDYKTVKNRERQWHAKRVAQAHERELARAAREAGLVHPLGARARRAAWLGMRTGGEAPRNWAGMRANALAEITAARTWLGAASAHVRRARKNVVRGG